MTSSDANSRKQRIKWGEGATLALLDFLRENKDELSQLKSTRGGSKPDADLWNRASDYLCNLNHNVNNIQAFTKWKNLLDNYKDDEDEGELRYLRKRRDKKKSTADLLEVYINHCISQQEERRKERELKEKERKERHERREKLDMMMFNILHNISMPFIPQNQG
ncbi:16920_t:CDS:2 [Entrophospora sp. SA101]|nr:16920_t:CDS:2 [Entrophospora sp. SA101]